LIGCAPLALAIAAAVPAAGAGHSAATPFVRITTSGLATKVAAYGHAVAR
jgi:hypothetical protein